MFRVVLFLDADGTGRDEGYIEFTDLLEERANDWAYRCQPSGLLPFEHVREIAEQILLRPHVNFGTVERYRWERVARAPAGTQSPSPQYSERA